MLLVDESMRAGRGKLALLDFGLVAELGAREREGMVRDAVGGGGGKSKGEVAGCIG